MDMGKNLLLLLIPLLTATGVDGWNDYPHITLHHWNSSPPSSQSSSRSPFPSSSLLSSYYSPSGFSAQTFGGDFSSRHGGVPTILMRNPDGSYYVPHYFHFPDGNIFRVADGAILNTRTGYWHYPDNHVEQDPGYQQYFAQQAALQRAAEQKKRDAEAAAAAAKKAAETPPPLSDEQLLRILGDSPQPKWIKFDPPLSPYQEIIEIAGNVMAETGATPEQIAEALVPEEPLTPNNMLGLKRPEIIDFYPERPPAIDHASPLTVHAHLEPPRFLPAPSVRQPVSQLSPSQQPVQESIQESTREINQPSTRATAELASKPAQQLEAPVRREITITRFVSEDTFNQIQEAYQASARQFERLAKELASTRKPHDREHAKQLGAASEALSNIQQASKEFFDYLKGMAIGTAEGLLEPAVYLVKEMGTTAFEMSVDPAAGLYNLALRLVGGAQKLACGLWDCLNLIPNPLLPKDQFEAECAVAAERIKRLYNAFMHCSYQERGRLIGKEIGQMLFIGGSLKGVGAAIQHIRTTNTLCLSLEATLHAAVAKELALAKKFAASVPRVADFMTPITHAVTQVGEMLTIGKQGGFAAVEEYRVALAGVPEGIQLPKTIPTMRKRMLGNLPTEASRTRTAGRGIKSRFVWIDSKNPETKKIKKVLRLKDPSARAPVGRRGKTGAAWPDGTRNVSTQINDRVFSAHALDRMQERGFLPAMVNEVLENGVVVKINPKKKVITYYQSTNDLSVVVNYAGDVVTVCYGLKK
jgi:hypothetical protein